jgi:hypothetical protein
VAVEIVRTLCGSIGLVAAVPITTMLAAILVGTAPPDALGLDPAPEPDPSTEPEPSAKPEPSADPNPSAEQGDRRYEADAPPEPSGTTATGPSWDDFAPREN